MFSLALKKFNQLRKNKFKSKEYDLSSSDLFELIITKNFKKGRYYFKEFPVNLILLILSLYTIVKAKIKKINKANYFIAFNEEIYDPRSSSYISQIKQANYVNIIRTNTFFVNSASFSYIRH